MGRLSCVSPLRTPRTCSALPLSRWAYPGSALRGWPTSPTGAPGTSAFLPPPAFPRCCSPAASASSWTVRLPGHERDPRAITDTDIDEFVRTYSRPDGWRGAIGLYRSMLQEGDEIATLVAGTS